MCMPFEDYGPPSVGRDEMHRLIRISATKEDVVNAMQTHFGVLFGAMTNTSDQLYGYLTPPPETKLPVYNGQYRAAGESFICYPTHGSDNFPYFNPATAQINWSTYQDSWTTEIKLWNKSDVVNFLNQYYPVSGDPVQQYKTSRNLRSELHTVLARLVDLID